MTETTPLQAQQNVISDAQNSGWEACRRALVKSCTNEIPLWVCKWMKLETEKALWIATAIGMIIHGAFLFGIYIFVDVSSILSIIGVKYKVETFNRVAIFVIIVGKIAYNICKEMGVAYSEMVEKAESIKREQQREQQHTQREQAHHREVIAAIAALDRNDIASARRMLSSQQFDSAVKTVIGAELSGYDISRIYDPSPNGPTEFGDQGLNRLYPFASRLEGVESEEICNLGQSVLQQNALEIEE
jgi:hypothetical protein